MNSDSYGTTSASNWNKVNWFGGIFGGSAWLLLFSIIALLKAPLFALACFGCFFVMNAYGYYLWQRRDNLAAYVAIQRILLVTTAINAFFVVFVQALKPFGENEKSSSCYWIILLPPALMIYFFVCARNGVEKKPNDAESAEHQRIRT